MNNAELQNYVLGKLDCLIGSAIKLGLRVSPNHYNVTGNKNKKWMYIQGRIVSDTFPAGAQVHPFDLVIMGRQVFDQNQWREAARYLMIPRLGADNVMETISNGMAGHIADASRTPIDAYNWNKLGLEIRSKYRRLGF